MFSSSMDSHLQSSSVTVHPVFRSPNHVTTRPSWHSIHPAACLWIRALCRCPESSTSEIGHAMISYRICNAGTTSGTCSTVYTCEMKWCSTRLLTVDPLQYHIDQSTMKLDKMFGEVSGCINLGAAMKERGQNS